VCSGKGNEPIEPIVRDILVPQVEIANWEFLYVWRIKKSRASGKTKASSYQCESTTILICSVDYPGAYLLLGQKRRHAIEHLTMRPNNEALAVEIG
jgi:hypothetical protein